MQTYSSLLQLLKGLFGTPTPDGSGMWDPWGTPETNAGSIWDPDGNA
jgi:hypothetical protein